MSSWCPFSDENHWKNDYPDEGDWPSDQSSPSLESEDDPSSNPPQSFRFREPYFGRCAAFCCFPAFVTDFVHFLGLLPDESDPFEDDLDYHRLGSW